MTREEKIKILEEAQERAYEQIAKTPGEEMSSEAFTRLVNVLNSMDHHAFWELDDPKSPFRDTEAPAETMEDIEAANHPESEEPEPEPEQSPEPVENDENEESEKPKYKMEEVRAALAKARTKGVNVAEIIRSYGVDNFQQIDAAKYPDVMSKLAEEGVA